MARIKLTVDFPVKDGSTFKFRAPCDCTAVDGLAISYPVAQGSTQTKTTNFTFKDAHGNTLTGIGDLFVAGVMIKVMLDVTAGVAFIQNADTNKYLEDAINSSSTFVYEQNQNDHMTFWIGTQREYDSLTSYKHNCLYLIEDPLPLNVDVPVAGIGEIDHAYLSEGGETFVPVENPDRYSQILMDDVLLTKLERPNWGCPHFRGSRAFLEEGTTTINLHCFDIIAEEDGLRFNFTSDIEAQPSVVATLINPEEPYITTDPLPHWDIYRLTLLR